MTDIGRPMREWEVEEPAIIPERESEPEQEEETEPVRPETEPEKVPVTPGHAYRCKCHVCFLARYSTKVPAGID